MKRSDLLEADEDSEASEIGGFDLVLDRSGYRSFDPNETAENQQKSKKIRQKKKTLFPKVEIERTIPGRGDCSFSTISMEIFPFGIERTLKSDFFFFFLEFRWILSGGYYNNERWGSGTRFCFGFEFGGLSGKRDSFANSKNNINLLGEETVRKRSAWGPPGRLFLVFIAN